MMQLFFLILLISGPIAIFVFSRKGWGVLKPAIVCVVLGFVGIGLFAYGMSNVSLLEARQDDVPPIVVIGFFTGLFGIIGTILMAVVLVARWLSGEYTASKQEM